MHARHSERSCRFVISNTCATNGRIASKEPCRLYNAETPFIPARPLTKAVFCATIDAYG